MKFWGIGKRGKKRKKEKIVALIDLENILANIEPPLPVFVKKYITLPQFLQAVLEDATKENREANKLLFVFAPLHLYWIFAKELYEMGFFRVVCPKIEQNGRKKDTVDETLIKVGKEIIEQENVRCLVLGSGDKDFLPLLQGAKEKGVRIIIAAGSKNSLAKDIAEVADKVYLFSQKAE